MAVRPIVKFPDPRLRQVAEPVLQFDADLRALVDDIYDTMLAAPGMGITGPHLGVLKRIVVIQLSANDPKRVYINPEVVSSSSETKRHLEGSVSMPGVSDDVERPAVVHVRYQMLVALSMSRTPTACLPSAFNTKSTSLTAPSGCSVFQPCGASGS